MATGLGLAMSGFIDRQRGREFTASEAVDALREYKSDAVRYRLNWLVAREDLCQHKRDKGRTTVYQAPGAVADGAGAASFRVSGELLSAMGRLAGPKRAPVKIRPLAPNMSAADMSAWVLSLTKAAA